MINEAVAGAIDIGGTKIAVGIVDSEGRVRMRAETPTAPEQGYPAALQRMTTMLRDAISQSGGQMNGIGIGATGPIDPGAGVFGDVGNLPGWKGAPLAADLAGEFEVPVVMENDADAAALGEATWGAGRGKKSFIYVTISTGIGAGVVLEGRLYRGAGGAHPEIGHQVIDTSGPSCYCRAQGCWESLASGPAMEAWFRASKGEELPARRICELARECDPVAVQAVEREARYLGLGLANLRSEGVV
jgi:glucokinase